MIKKFLPLLLMCCASTYQGLAQNTTVDSIRVDGQFRSFRLYTPNKLQDGKPPLVINMHGLGSNAFEQEYYSNFAPIADTAGFYVVMPQGTSFNGTAFWDVGFPGAPVVNDVRFIDSLISHLIRSKNVDPGRVYATGMSNGGFMSYLLALKLPDRIAAIASVTGGIVPNVLSMATLKRPVPAMEIHGTADATVPYGGGSINAPVDSVISFFVRGNGCNKVPVRTAVPDLNILDGCTADHFRYASPGGAADVELYRVNNGGHTWPGASVIIGITNQDFSASKEIWRFFSKYRAPGLDVPGQGRVEAEPVRIIPNPVQGILRLQAPGDGTVRVYDMRGSCIVNTNTKVFDMAPFPAGHYLLRYTTADGSISRHFVRQD